MYLSRTNIQVLRDKVENDKGFQIALVPMQPNTFLNVKMATDILYAALTEKGVSVLVDDTDKKPKDKFKVVEFLNVHHRVVISSRSISAGVYEYKDLQTDEFVKVPESEAADFLKNKVI